MALKILGVAPKVDGEKSASLISPLCSTLQIKLSFVPPQVNANKDEVEIMTDGWFKVRFEKINKYFNSTSDQYLMMRVGVFQISC